MNKNEDTATPGYGGGKGFHYRHLKEDSPGHLEDSLRLNHEERGMSERGREKKKRGRQKTKKAENQESV